MSRTSVRLGLTRRQMLRNAGGVIAGAALPARALAAAAVQAGAERPVARAEVTGLLARYMAESSARAMPPDVTREAKHRILDTLAAMISGSRLKPGELAIRYARTQGGVPEASIVATSIRTSAVTAALANGMFAHADETDDFEPFTKAHPGCRRRSSRPRGCRAPRSIGPGAAERRHPRLRLVLSLAHGARARSCPRHSSKR